MSSVVLAALLTGVAVGEYPAADGSVTIVPQPSARDAGVISFTAHAVVFTNADPDRVRGQLPPGDLSGPLAPRFLQPLCERTGRGERARLPRRRVQAGGRRGPAHRQQAGMTTGWRRAASMIAADPAA
jgi:hypothetical protein